jgi:hypothetical protein
MLLLTDFRWARLVLNGEQERHESCGWFLLPVWLGQCPEGTCLATTRLRQRIGDDEAGCCTWTL